MSTFVLTGHGLAVNQRGLVDMWLGTVGPTSSRPTAAACDTRRIATSSLADIFSARSFASAELTDTHTHTHTGDRRTDGQLTAGDERLAWERVNIPHACSATAYLALRT